MKSDSSENFHMGLEVNCWKPCGSAEAFQKDKQSRAATSLIAWMLPKALELTFV
jgi:hypothetical protein